MNMYPSKKQSSLDSAPKGPSDLLLDGHGFQVLGVPEPSDPTYLTTMGGSI